MNVKLNTSRRGFTLIEFICVVAVLAIVAALLLPMLAESKARSSRISCVGRLKSVALSFHVWAHAHTNAFPMAISTNFGGTLEHTATGEVWPHFQVMSNELNAPVMLFCPSDRNRTPPRNFGPNLSNTNISYFVGLDANATMPQMFLAGDRNLVGGTLLPNRILLLTTNDVVSWSKDLHNQQGNVALADGSVQGFSSSRLQAALRDTGSLTNRLAIP